VLPQDTSSTFEVAPDSVVALHAENPPPGATVRWSISGLGRLGGATRPIGDTTSTTVDMAEYSKYGRGLFKLDVALLSGITEVCATTLNLRITGFGGTAAIASVAATGATAVAAVLGSLYSATGIQAKLKVQVRRRRRSGWRRWVPVPAWKRTIFGSIVGAIAGLCVAALLQQTGLAPLSLASAICGIAAGGVMSFGAGIALGTVWTYLRPPEEPAEGK